MFRVERALELRLPIECAARLGHFQIPVRGAFQTARHVAGVRGDFVGDHAFVHLLGVGQAQMFRRRHIAQERRPVCRRGGRPNGGNDMVVPRGDIDDHGSQDVKRRPVAEFLLLFHVHLHLVEGNMPRTLHHDLHARRTRPAHKFSQNGQFPELCRVARIRQTARTQSVPQRNRHVVLAQNLANLIPARVKRVFRLVVLHPLRHDRPAAGDDPHDALLGERNVRQKESGMKRHEVHALFRLFLYYAQKEFRIHDGDVARRARKRFIDGNRAEGNRRSLEHALPDGYDIRPDREIHDKIGAGFQGDGEFVQLVALPRTGRGTPEIGVDFRAEQPPHAHRMRIFMVYVQRNHRASACNRRAHLLGRQPLVHRDLAHRVRYDSLPGRFQLSHNTFSLIAKQF